MSARFLAFDLGAESGRAVLGTLESGQLHLEELHRFPNTPVRLPTGLYWDTLRLFHEMRHGLTIAGRERGLQLDGVGVDTWGVDFGLLDAQGALLGNPHHYRDSRTGGMVEHTFAQVPRERVFAATGIQVMPINTLYQLRAMQVAGSPALAQASKLLFMPDLFCYWLSGVQRGERTIASTSQCYDPYRRAWATELLAELGLPARIWPELVDAGTRLGPLLPEVASTAGLDPATPVYATAGHDTAAAIAAVPAQGNDWCYISSGTWSLMGVERAAPVVNERCRALNFTNEAGVGGTTRLLKNIAGLWPLQECRRAWGHAGHVYTYEELVRMAESAPPFAAVLDPDAFPEPDRMPERIAAYCQRTGQTVLTEPGAVTLALLEGLALRYRRTLEMLEELTGEPISVVHIVGGGSRNRLLNQFAADATGRRVVAGPAEATAAGNVLVQAVGAGLIESFAAAREVVRRSFAVEVYEPQGRAAWDVAYAKFCGVAS